MRRNRGVGLIEVMISIVIAMLLVLVIYQIYEISEGQRRTITGGSDAQQNASYGMYVLGRDLAMAGNGIASAASVLKDCPVSNLLLPDSRKAPDPLETLRPIPVVIKAADSADNPDEITVFSGVSSSLSTPVSFWGPQLPAYQVRAPVGFSAKDVIAAVQGTKCTLSTIDDGGVAVDGNGIATITHTRFAGDPDAGYGTGAVLVNLGQVASMSRVVYSVDTTTNTLRAQDQYTRTPPLTEKTTPSPVVSDVVNLRAQYGLDNNCDGTITWQPATGAWASDSVPALPLATPVPCVAPAPPALQQIRAVRIAIVTRSTQWEFDPVTRKCIVLTPGPLKMLDDTVLMDLDLIPDGTCYRYKVLETIVPLRNALWNGS